MELGFMHGLIISESFYDVPRTSISRSTGAHRMATLFRSVGVHVEVLDFFNSWTLIELEQFALKYTNLDFMGISSVLGKLNTELVNGFIRILKTKFPNIKILSGGSDVLENDFDNIDLYIRGFADGAVPDIITYIKTNKYPNLLYLESIKTHNTKKIVDCNKHYLNFDLSNLKTLYTENDFITDKESLTLETGRGCIFKCTFCNFPLTGKNRNDYIRDPDDIKNELLENYKKSNITRYSITDDTFNDNPLKVDNLLKVSKELPFKLQMMCYARVDLLYAHENMLEKMVESGFVGLFFGIESLDVETSRLIGKKFTGEKLINYLTEIKRKYPKLHLTGSLIVGLPNESIQNVRNNILSLTDKNLFDCLYIYPLQIPKNNGANYISPFSKNWKEYGYQEMTVDEVKDTIKNNLQKYNYFNSINLEDISCHYVFWKNEHMNWMDAIITREQLKKEIDFKIAMGGWSCFTMTYTGLSLDHLMYTKRPDLDWETIKDLATKYVDDYKVKKLSISIN